MKRCSFLVVCVLFVSGFLNNATAKIPPCSVPAAISGPDTVCESSVIALSDTTAGGNWSSSNNAIATIGSLTGIVTGISGGSATITYSLTSGCFVTMPVFVKPILPITGSTAICAGSSGIFSDLSTGGTWNSSNTSVATINATTGSATGYTSGITRISYTIPNGCTVSVMLTVNPLPPNYYVFGGGYYCAGTSGATVGLNGSDPGINYILYNGTTFVDSLYGTGSALFYGPYTAAGTYQIYGVNIATGCINRMSGIAVIGVIPDNVPSVNITTPVGDTVCILANTVFTAIPVNAGASPSYQWFVNGGRVGTTGNTYSYIPTNGDVVSVTVISDAVCAIPATASNSMTMTTIPKVNPSVSISVIPGDTVCAFTPVTIIPTPVNGGSAPTYRWIKNGITATYGPVYNFYPANGDNILCSIHSNYECLIVDSAYSINNIEMTVIPLETPTVTVTAHPGDTIAQWEHDTLVAVVTGGTDLAYQWKINGIAIPGATTDTFTSNSLANKDSVSCTVTSSFRCSSGPVSDYVIITDTLNPLGVLQPGAKDAVSLMPNPNKGVFKISGVFTPDNVNVTIEITDILGQLVYKHNTPIEKGKLHTQINVGEQLPAGAYVVRVSANNACVFRKLVIER